MIDEQISRLRLLGIRWLREAVLPRHSHFKVIIEIMVAASLDDFTQSLYRLLPIMLHGEIDIARGLLPSLLTANHRHYEKSRALNKLIIYELLLYLLFAF